MYTIRNTLLLMITLVLTACAVSSAGFDHLDYSVTTKKVVGKLALIIPQETLQKQFTVPATVLKATHNQEVAAGQMLVDIADYEYPKIFGSYERVKSMAAISPGFYRAIMELNVTSFNVKRQTVNLSVHAKIYSYQGKLLYEKSFIGSAKISTSLKIAALTAYQSAMHQINERLEQLLYWEDRQSNTYGKI